MMPDLVDGERLRCRITNMKELLLIFIAVIFISSCAEPEEPVYVEKCPTPKYHTMTTGEQIDARLEHKECLLRLLKSTD